MSEPSDWPPAASLETLRIRAQLLAAVRRFFDDRGYWEVDTPLVSQERVIDANLDPFVVLSEADARTESAGRVPRLFLQTSPEFAMKRLLAAGANAIFQLAHVFRQGELGRLHNPEFTMVEWYRVGDTHEAQMQVVEDLVMMAFSAVRSASVDCNAVLFPLPAVPQVPFLRTTYREAFTRHTGADLAVLDAQSLAEWARRHRLHPPPGLEAEDRDGWLNWLLAELVEPHLGRERPEFVCDYPASLASLARIRPESPPVAERFELYSLGIELCNGYHELSDAVELRQRIESESARRTASALPPMPVPQRLLHAMESGLPDCAGVALGVDRLFMLALGAHSIHEVLPFSFEQS